MAVINSISLILSSSMARQQAASKHQRNLETKIHSALLMLKSITRPSSTSLFTIP
jgi:hypothetical protein